MNQSYAIGLDIGTTSTKAVVYTVQGEVKGSGSVDYPITVPHPGWAEQDPEVIYAAVLQALRDAVAAAGIRREEIAAIGFSTAMHSLIAVDAEGRPLTNSIIWADNRSSAQAERLKREGIGREIYLRTGTPIHPMSPLAKLIWMREEAPDIFRRAAKFISIKEYVLHRMFGVYVVDYSIASATGLFDIRRLAWEEEALRTAGIRRGQLSEPVPTTHILRGFSREAADSTGLSPDTPFVVGASDGVLANLGVGAVEPGQIAVTIGTSGAVRAVVDRPLTDREGRTFCYVLTDNRWVIGGPTNNGGLMLRWFRDQFSAEEREQAQSLGIDPYEVMVQKAAAVPAGAEGLLFLPFLAGERAPHWNADARGSFFGIGLHHRREHFIRAVLEGILFGVYDVAAVLRELAGEAVEIRASGGFARSAEWRQMMADMFGIPVLVPQTHESSSFGAALMALWAVGAIADLDEGRRLITLAGRQEPVAAHKAVYEELFAIYQLIYRHTVQEMAALASFQRLTNGQTRM
ncbi:gluconokinase [Brevibacillus sp. SYP-B805]|uniref:gluconokinase n=1 Tax=Brevibacillus sp. SYP-B805 TaxID=1578199 RepID=UPI0013EA4D74|nr:gluconokinase [Brevibacillus sp. SYP-B805]NGQ95939.1 gluconokinase [Brevibacillus sp. SYP-B805]